MAVLFISAALLMFSVQTASRTAESGDGSQRLGEMELARKLGEQLQEERTEAWPVLLVLGTIPVVLAVGTALLVVCITVYAKRGRLLPKDWRHDPTWRPRDVLIVAGLWVVAGNMLGLAVLPDHMRHPAHPAFWLSQLAAYAVALAAIWVVVRIRQSSRAALGLHARRLGRNIGLGLLAFFCVTPLYATVMFVQGHILRKLGIEQVPQEVVRVMATGDATLTLVLLPVTAILIAPFVEEVLFRGFIQGMLRRYCGAGMALTGGAVLFASIHGNIFAFATLLILGFALGYLYDRTQSLAAPVTLHCAFNASSMALLGAYRLSAG